MYMDCLNEFASNDRFFACVDWSHYTSDKRATVDENCTLSEQEDIAVFNDDCAVHVLKMCNGLMHCDDCADENYEDCLAQQCSESII